MVKQRSIQMNNMGLSGRAKYTQREYNTHIPTVRPTIVFLSTYPPRECGIATFTQDLLTSSQKFLGPLVDCKVAALNLSPLDTHKYPKEVAWQIDQNSTQDYRELANTLNADIHVTGVIIQHEYGIFGDTDGQTLLSFMNTCTKPMLVTLHTTLPHPSVHMQSVTSQIIQKATTVIVLTQSSRDIITRLYPHAKGKIFIIPHGIHPVALSDPKKFKAKLDLRNRIVLTTFGLLSRGKGIEYAIRALPDVIKQYPTALYLILGETHPVVRRNEGEEYRLELATLVRELHLEEHVRFYDQYFDLPDLLEFLKATDIYIATSINPNQAVSGTLSYALGAGLPVISTEFAQAKEIVSPEAGRLVPIQDSAALTHAINDLLSDNDRLQAMHAHAYTLTRPMLWDTIAETYISLLGRIVLPPLNLAHLKSMTDDFGLFQFAALTIPDKQFGYTLDDNARALIVCSWLLKNSNTEEIQILTALYLGFIHACQSKDGSFVNYLGQDKQPTHQNDTEDLEDSQARAIWALAEIMSNPACTAEVKKQATSMYLRYIKHAKPMNHLRAMAFAIKAHALALALLPLYRHQLIEIIQEYADTLVQALATHSYKSWRWFEKDLNYNNAVLSESLIIAGQILENKDIIERGLLSLAFLITKTFSTTYMPIGQTNWYVHNKKRSIYDQQPEDPAAMILALIRAYTHTGETQYKLLAHTCFSWFLGNNSLNASLYDERTGGCYDGLHPTRVNLNCGAESLVSYLMSRIQIAQLHTQ